MNERIWELWDQAKLDPTNEDAHHLLEKFAELIVQECIDTVLDSSVEYTTRPQVAIEIKEHFGVEE